MSPDDMIVIADGAFAGCKGIYQQQISTERIAVLLDIIGKITALTPSIHDLQLAKST